MSGDSAMPRYTFEWMDATHADEILQWKYPAPYQIYSLDDNEEDKAELLNGTYYYALDERGELAGYFCVGGSARVPGGYPVNLYSDDSCLDIGLGLRPEMTGKGLGSGFLTQVIAFVNDEFQPRQLQLVVTSFNKRAISVYRKAGFYKIAQFESMIGGEMIAFIAMRRNVRQPVLVTERLRLRAMTGADGEDLFELIRKNSTGGHTGEMSQYASVTGCKEQIETWNNKFYTDNAAVWGITQLSANVLIGWIGLENKQPDTERADLCIYLSPAYRGQGIGHEALRAVTAFGLAYGGVARIQALAEPSNYAYCRLLEAAGYQREGKLREYVLREGGLADTTVYSFLERDAAAAEDWPPAFETIF